MQDRAKRVLAHDGSIQMLTATNVRVERDGRVEPADLSSKHVGCLIENATPIDVLANLGEGAGCC